MRVDDDDLLAHLLRRLGRHPEQFDVQYISRVDHRPRRRPRISRIIGPVLVEPPLHLQARDALVALGDKVEDLARGEARLRVPYALPGAVAKVEVLPHVDEELALRELAALVRVPLRQQLHRRHVRTQQHKLQLPAQLLGVPLGGLVEQRVGLRRVDCQLADPTAQAPQVALAAIDQQEDLIEADAALSILEQVFVHLPAEILIALVADHIESGLPALEADITEVIGREEGEKIGRRSASLAQQLANLLAQTIRVARDDGVAGRVDAPLPDHVLHLELLLLDLDLVPRDGHL